MDGFFVAKFKKFANGEKSDDKEKDALCIKQKEALQKVKDKKRNKKGRGKENKNQEKGKNNR
jgi:hypothetical protein